MALSAGQLDKRVALQKPVVTHVNGEKHMEWVTVAVVWASVSPVSAREQFTLAQLQADVSHRVRMRYRPNVTAEWRVQYAGRVLNIAAMPRDLDEAHVELELLCKEVQP